MRELEQYTDTHDGDTEPGGWRHDWASPDCVKAMHNGQSCALCRWCQLIRDALDDVQHRETGGGGKNDPR